MPMNISAPARTLLDWHQGRRASGIPTVTTLAGPINLAVRVWRGWANPRSVSVVRTADSLNELTSAWASDALYVCSGFERAREWLARVTNQSLAAVIRHTDRATRYDLDRLWRSLPVDPTGPASRVAFLLIAAHANGTGTDPAELVRELSGGEHSAGPEDVFRGLHALCAGALVPALLVAPEMNVSSSWFVRTFSFLASVATAVPELPVVIAAPLVACETYAADAASRPAAMAREGLIVVEDLSEAELTARLREAGVVPLPAAATLRRLVADGLTEGAAEAFVEAACAVRNPAPGDDESDFRSVHEKFLFDQLEAMPATAGQFQPNAALPFPHGHRAAEADLLAAKSKLVVEIDGTYYHLNKY